LTYRRDFGKLGGGRSVGNLRRRRMKLTRALALLGLLAK
jgi:hypothetical protein